MTVIDEPPAVALRRMTTAYWTSQVIFVAVTLRIPDLLANRPQTSEALAVTTDTLRRPSPARPGESRLAPPARRVQENGGPAHAPPD
jgi:hypothetical protein